MVENEYSDWDCLSMKERQMLSGYDFKSVILRDP